MVHPSPADLGGVSPGAVDLRTAHLDLQSMVLCADSGANVSRQGINPAGAGGEPRVYPATTLAALAAWTPPESRRCPPGPVSLSQMPDPGSVECKTPLKL
ncbi:unnamed protein product [Pleuronectes platessa]|uniref:Uncharacterized protein n=1 Tax=Pleuronectes platessa TaxID=8262 RepID=A0A9N7UGC4_PLEPL|nr:unnamed protein product [Pleuronectes platessa]